MRVSTATLATWGFIVLALGLYSLPWLVTPGASLTLNAYDLAEWTSLNPVVRDASPTLLITFGLRFLLLLIAAFVAFSPIANKWLWWICAGFVLCLALALLPPFAFFGDSSGDPNYRQQFALSLLTLLAGAVGLSQRLARWRHPIQTGLVLAGLLSSAAALVEGASLMRLYALPVQLGIGGMLFVVLQAAVLGILIMKSKRGNLGQVTSHFQQA